MVDNASTQKLHRLAIESALQCQWDQALEYNKQLLATEPDNITCLNRMAKAYLELGKYDQAQKFYHEVLKLDPYNNIAQKNLQKASAFKKDGVIPHHTNGHAITISPSFFLEEPGLTKLVTLIKVAEPQRLLTLSPGLMVNLVARNRSISVTDLDHQYLGALPDDTSHHLLKLIKGGNKYQAYIKSIKTNKITLLIRETFRSKKFKNQASFLDGSKILSYSSDHIALLNNDGEDSEPAEETEEVVV